MSSVNSTKNWSNIITKVDTINVVWLILRQDNQERVLRIRQLTVKSGFPENGGINTKYTAIS